MPITVPRVFKITATGECAIVPRMFKITAIGKCAIVPGLFLNYSYRRMCHCAQAFFKLQLQENAIVPRLSKLTTATGECAIVPRLSKNDNSYRRMCLCAQT